MADQIALTFDTDWVPDFVLEPVLDQLESCGLNATFFFTSSTNISTHSGIEKAIHPNFMEDSTQGDSVEEILDTLLESFPNACGVRTHRLFWYSGLVHPLKKRNILYDSSIFLPFSPHLSPVRYDPIIRVPYWWSDHRHLLRELRFDRIQLPNLTEPGLKVFDFHPLHVYLNTPDLEAHSEFMNDLHPIQDTTKSQLEEYQFDGKGIGTFFETFCNYIKSNNLSSSCLKDIINHYSTNKQ